MAVPAPSSPLALPIPDSDKPALRRAALARRQAAFESSAGAALAFHFLDGIDLPAGATVAGYMPMAGELDIVPLMTTLAARGHPLALPVVVRGEPVLTFRTWIDGAPLEGGAAGTRHPPASAPLVTPRVLLVPLLAIDADGYRLGYGKGYYDLTIARLRAMGPILAVGVGFAAQAVDRLPRDPWDQPLDAFVSEAGVRRFA